MKKRHIPCFRDPEACISTSSAFLGGLSFFLLANAKLGKTLPTGSEGFFNWGDSIQLVDNKGIKAASLPSVNAFCETVLQLIVEPYPR